MDIAGWLRGLGLEQYEPVFRSNDIDGAVLPTLTAEDLKDLGIASVGHRRRLLEAITALREGGEPAAKVQASAEAERRQLTVMFCDLVGSTELSTNLDPEDLREVIAAYHRGVAETVGRFAGFVAKYMGDGVLVYFGYPQAHEDDAERAVRAGLDLISGIGQITACKAVQVRVGVATGLVVVGWRGRRAGAGGRWRDPEPCRSSAESGSAGRIPNRYEHATPRRRPLRI